MCHILCFCFLFKQKWLYFLHNELLWLGHQKKVKFMTGKRIDGVGLWLFVKKRSFFVNTYYSYVRVSINMIDGEFISMLSKPFFDHFCIKKPWIHLLKKEIILHVLKVIFIYFWIWKKGMILGVKKLCLANFVSLVWLEKNFLKFNFVCSLVPITYF